MKNSERDLMFDENWHCKLEEVIVWREAMQWMENIDSICVITKNEGWEGIDDKQVAVSTADTTAKALK